MPLYEYECESCSHRFEVIQKFSDAPISACPQCGGPVQKLLSSPAIQFKGSGFYLTDYGRGTGSKSDSTTTKAGTSESGATGSGGDSGAKTDSGGSSDTKAATSDTSSAKPAKPAAAKSE